MFMVLIILSWVNIIVETLVFILSFVLPIIIIIKKDKYKFPPFLVKIAVVFLACVVMAVFLSVYFVINRNTGALIQN
jgi:hypothetical protein